MKKLRRVLNLFKKQKDIDTLNPQSIIIYYHDPIKGAFGTISINRKDKGSYPQEFYDFDDIYTYIINCGATSFLHRFIGEDLVLDMCMFNIHYEEKIITI